jgi:medium-chain acyl-[acyl-carrier-protein] hydrolase
MAALPWFRGPLTGDKPLRLLCIPHAGGGASFFNSWTLRLEHALDVVRLQLPGREDRAKEKPLSDIDVVLAEVCPLIDEYLSDRPLIVYGHSLGALIAFEIARHLERQNRPAVCLLASSRRAPSYPLRHPPTWQLPDDRFVEHIVSLGAATPKLLQVAHWRDYFVPTMRADLSMTDRYTPAPILCLSSPVYVYRGKDDPIVDPDEMAAWAFQARTSFRLSTVDGGHFLAESGVATILADIWEIARTFASSNSLKDGFQSQKESAE